mmetsp:Transcript_14796/g.36192  ORF Transcript_14796/g.36192 Transcript_14796/m.36192 type:complete len:89 (-) Transcript_14796:530-796(-)
MDDAPLRFGITGMLVVEKGAKCIMGFDINHDEDRCVDGLLPWRRTIVRIDRNEYLSDSALGCLVVAGMVSGLAISIVSCRQRRRSWIP